MYRLALVAKRVGVCVAAAATTMAVVSAPTAQAQPVDPVTVVLSGLNNPYDVQFGTLGLMFVAENGGAQITAAIPALGFSLPIVGNLSGIASATSPFGQLLFVTGSPEPDPMGPPPPPPPAGSPDPASLYAANLFGPPHKIADLTAYELAHNPDGQLQFDPVTHAPLDALSNPFRVLKRGFFDDAYIADGGANDVLTVDFFGNVRTLFVPPTVNTGTCAGLANNSLATVGCDSVPTGLAFGPDGKLYVSAFTSGKRGEGRVYVLDPRNGALQRTITGLDGPTGVTVGDDGSVYVTEVTYSASQSSGPPAQGPPPGRIVKIAPGGTQSAAAVPLPLGITFHDGALYSTAFSLAGPGAGKVVRVAPSAFTPLTAP
ncbi:MAG: ScyD/ScyE family protein [Actinomycetota bacterium]|nr:ScyD/ScyE family protein [Actinomycetota bacterium]